MVDLEVSCIPDEFSPEFDEVCEYLQEQNVKYVELRKVWIGNVCEVDRRTLEDAKDILNDCGLKVSSIAGPLLKCTPPSANPDPKEQTDYSKNWKYNYSKFEHILDTADFFDAPYIRVFAYRGENDDEYPWNIPPIDQWDSWQIYKDWSETVSEFKETAAERGIMLVCENDSGFNRSLGQILKIGAEHTGEGFGMLFDTGNIALHERPGILTDEALDKVGKYVQYVHAKGVKEDSNGNRRITIVNSPDGIARWPDIVRHFRTMSADNFIAPPPDPLFLSIETHMGKENIWENSAQSLKNLMDLVY